MTQSDPLQTVGWRQLGSRSAAMIIAAVGVLLVQGGRTVYTYGGVDYDGYGWPAVSSTYGCAVAGQAGWVPNAPLPRRLLHRSPWGFAINGVTLLAIVFLASMLDRLGRPEQFGLWRLFAIMLACSIIFACLRAAEAHNPHYLKQWSERAIHWGPRVLPTLPLCLTADLAAPGSLPHSDHACVLA